MSYVRTKKQDNPFVQLDKHFLEDDQLSWKAKGILAYLLSKPDGWQVRKTDLIKKSTGGKSTVQTGLEELMKLGYIYYFQERNQDGKFGEWIYEVYERPEFNPKLLEGEKIIQMRVEKREKKRLENKETTESRKPETGVQPKADFPTPEKPTPEKPTPENQPYSNNLDSINNDFINNDYINNHHHHLMKVGFNKKQSTLIMDFALQNNLKIDDDDFHKLVRHLMKYKPNSTEYIAKAYNTVVNENRNYKVMKTKENKLEDLKSYWEREIEKQQKKTPAELQQEAEEIEQILQRYSANSK